jgi:hypothetical protein
MRFISLAIVIMNVFGFELAIIDSEFLDILQISAFGVNGKFNECLK